MNETRVRIVWDLSQSGSGVIARRFTKDAFGNPIPPGRLLGFEINGRPADPRALGVSDVSGKVEGPRDLQTRGGRRLEFDLVIASP